MKKKLLNCIHKDADCNLITVELDRPESWRNWTHIVNEDSYILIKDLLNSGFDSIKILNCTICYICIGIENDLLGENHASV